MAGTIEAVTEPVSAAGTKPPITETEEFKQEREKMRVNFEAEYRRKQQDLEAQYANKPPVQPVNTGRDFYDEWGERHSLPAEAARELVQGVIGYVNNTMLPTALHPITTSQKRQELRAQRTELRTSNPKLAKLDDKFSGEAMAMLDKLHPSQIGSDSYAKALQMVIGAHIEELDAEREQARTTAETREAEQAPGPEPLPSSGSTKPSKVVLNSEQQAFCTDRNYSTEEFVELQKHRARRLEATGLSKAQVRSRMGPMLGTIEF